MHASTQKERWNLVKSIMYKKTLFVKVLSEEQNIAKTSSDNVKPSGKNLRDSRLKCCTLRCRMQKSQDVLKPHIVRVNFSFDDMIIFVKISIIFVKISWYE